MATQQSLADAKQAAALATFAARKKTAAKTALGSAFSLAEKSAAIKSARAVMSATVTIDDVARQISDYEQIAGAIQAEVYRQRDAASAHNRAGRPRYTKTVRVTVELRVE